MDRTRRSGPGGPCGIEGVNYSSSVLIEGLHTCRQNLAVTPCLVPNNAGLSDFGAPVLISGPRILEVSLRLGF